MNLWYRVTEQGHVTSCKVMSTWLGPVCTAGLGTSRTVSKYHTAPSVPSALPVNFLSLSLGERVCPKKRFHNHWASALMSLGSLEKGCLQHWWYERPLSSVPPPKQDVDPDSVCPACLRPMIVHEYFFWLPKCLTV